MHLASTEQGVFNIIHILYDNIIPEKNIEPREKQRV